MPKKNKPLGLTALPKLDAKFKGIQGEGMYDPYWVLEHFKPNPKNYKKHDKEQRAALYESVKEHGWIVPMVVNIKTGFFVDGHGRVEMGAEYGIAVKIGFIHADEDEEASIIGTFDSLALMSETDPVAHQALIQKAFEYARTKGMKAMEGLAVSLSERAERIKSGQERAKDLITTRKKDLERRKAALTDGMEDRLTDNKAGEAITETVLVENPRFESSHPWKIPPLLPKKLFGCLKKHLKSLPERPWNPAENELEQNEVVCYSIRSAIEYEENTEEPWGFLGFYTEDHRFEHIYSQASERLSALNSMNFQAIFEPDFSVYSDWSLGENLWNIYRSRWCSRYLQELGSMIIPKIPVCVYDHPVKADYRESDHKTLAEDFMVSSIPKGTKIVCANGRMQHRVGKDVIELATINGIIRAWEYLHFSHVVLYGGLDIENHIHASFPSELKVIYLDSYINRRRKYNAEQKRMRKATLKNKP